MTFEYWRQAKQCTYRRFGFRAVFRPHVATALLTSRAPRRRGLLAPLRTTPNSQIARAQLRRLRRQRSLHQIRTAVLGHDRTAKSYGDDAVGQGLGRKCGGSRTMTTEEMRPQQRPLRQRTSRWQQATGQEVARLHFRGRGASLPAAGNPNWGAEALDWISGSGPLRPGLPDPDLPRQGRCCCSSRCANCGRSVPLRWGRRGAGRSTPACWPRRRERWEFEPVSGPWQSAAQSWICLKVFAGWWQCRALIFESRSLQSKKARVSVNPVFQGFYIIVLFLFSVNTFWWSETRFGSAN